ncbi:hypothetical protein DA2_0711 [Desulfovibrio sp. A2]|nr:hypothetical protein DA2_0711 [Desulfovibrio sp. A2]
MMNGVDDKCVVINAVFYWHGAQDIVTLQNNLCFSVDKYCTEPLPPVFHPSRH